MKIKELLKNKNLGLWYYDDSEKTLILEYSDTYVKLDLIVPDDYGHEEITKQSVVKNPDFYDHIKIIGITIGEVIYYNYEDDTEIIDPIYKTNRLFTFLNSFYTLKSQIPDFIIFDDYGDPFCRGPIMTKLEINGNGLEVDELSSFLNEVYSDNTQTPTNINCNLELAQIDKVFNSKIKILNTNTKTRRLGYLKFITELFNKSRYYPISYFSKLIEKEAFDVNKTINAHIDNKGIINQSRYGNSSKPYLELMIGLSLITNINNTYILTKQGKPYFVLNNLISKKEIIAKEKKLCFFEKSDSTSYFELNYFDKAFFLKQILKNDTLYFIAILDIFRIKNSPISILDIKTLFKNYILDELNRLKAESRSEAIEISKRIRNWKKEITYLEHIIEPRLNWMLDLDLIIIDHNKSKKLYRLNKTGLSLHTLIYSTYIESENKLKAINYILDNTFFQLFSEAFNLSKSLFQIDLQLIDCLTKEAFELFKTDAPNRIPASIAIDYICYIYFFKYDKIIEYNQVKQILLKSETIGIDWFASENDGSIFLK